MTNLSTLAYQTKNFWGNSSPCYTTHLCQPILNQSPKDTPLNFTSLGLRLSSHTSLFWTLPEQLSMLHHAFVSTHPEPTSQRYITKPQTLRFSSHTSVLNLARTAFHVTPRMWANPSWTNVPRHTTNFRSENVHLTHPCFELCRNSSPCYTTHVCQPILYQRPKIPHKLMTQFCKPILIQPPKIHLSKFQCSPYRRQKCRALQEDTVQ